MVVVGHRRISLAPGVCFDPELHEYTLGGMRLSGVTSGIARELGIDYGRAEGMLSDRCGEGTNIHSWVQEWVDTGVMHTVHPGALWVRDELERRYAGDEKCTVYSEVLVSDLRQYASAADIIVEHDGIWDIWDIKTGAFKPEYLAWQLGCYSWFMSLQGLRTGRCGCLCVKDRMSYRVLPRGSCDIRRLLYGSVPET